MNEVLVLVAIVGGITLLLLRLRVPAAIVFMSLLIGHILSLEVADEAYELITPLQDFDFNHIKLGLLVLPMVLSVIFLRKHVPKHKFLIELAPMLFAAVTLVLFAYPILPELERPVQEITDQKASSYTALIITFASASSLVSAWITYPRGEHGKKHKKH